MTWLERAAILDDIAFTLGVSDDNMIELSNASLAACEKHGIDRDALGEIIDEVAGVARELAKRCLK